MRVEIKDINSELVTRKVIKQLNEDCQDYEKTLKSYYRICKMMKLLNSPDCIKTKIQREDNSTFRICIYDSKNKEGKRKGVLWLHGGGYAIGAPEMVKYTFANKILERYNCVIVAPDYTLSINKPYPAALNDAYTALLWMDSHREELGITDDEYIIGGESAGGGLTCALCLYARDKGFNKIKLQIPLYPMLSDKLTNSQKDNNAPIWNEVKNDTAWKLYLKDDYRTDKVSKYAAPSRGTDLNNLPTAVSFIGTIEPFYDETVDYFGRMKKAGIDARLYVAEGAYHGYDIMAPKTDITKKTMNFMYENLDELI